MKIKVFFAMLLCKALRLISRILHRGGTAMPGRFALKICPELLSVLANAADYYRTDDLTVTLDYIDRQWVINADGSLLGALAGGTA